MRSFQLCGLAWGSKSGNVRVGLIDPQYNNRDPRSKDRQIEPDTSTFDSLVVESNFGNSSALFRYFPPSGSLT
jgi:hypothetical protein